MSRIRSRDTLPEILLRSELSRLGLRYRLHAKSLPGKPDIVNQRRRFAIFVHGCFWHQHRDCIQASSPKSNQAYWGPKLAANVLRDSRHIHSLEKSGYHVTVAWECEIEKDPRAIARQIVAALKRSRRISD
jgi:DNA mismatch endonuclease (patch repair protein)